jgi:hypothetical protein
MPKCQFNKLYNLQEFSKEIGLTVALKQPINGEFSSFAIKTYPTLK